MELEAVVGNRFYKCVRDHDGDLEKWRIGDDGAVIYSF